MPIEIRRSAGGKPIMLALRKQFFCTWCDLRIVNHHIGNHVRIWVHARSNVIWCWPVGTRMMNRTAAPRWSHKRKWSHA